MITGESEFNEVFFSDARCPKENVVGQVNGGWSVAMTLLGYERGEANTTTSLSFRTELEEGVDNPLLGIDAVRSTSGISATGSSASHRSPNSSR